MGIQKTRIRQEILYANNIRLKEKDDVFKAFSRMSSKVGNKMFKKIYNTFEENILKICVNSFGHTFLYDKP